MYQADVQASEEPSVEVAIRQTGKPRTAPPPAVHRLPAAVPRKVARGGAEADHGWVAGSILEPNRVTPQEAGEW
jgi:hypothetical protein